MSTKYQGSHMSLDPRPVLKKVNVSSVVPPGFSSEWEWDGFKGNVLRAHQASLLPANIKTPEQALVIALKGRELGLEPLYALSSIHLINGRPGLAAELMLSLVYRRYPKARINFITPLEKRNFECAIRCQREDGLPQEFIFSIEDANRANLLIKDNWKLYPAAMLRARATSAGVRATWPECTMGCHTPEELESSFQVLKSTSVSEIDSQFAIEKRKGDSNE